jgi:hypothetical protein
MWSWIVGNNTLENVVLKLFIKLMVDGRMSSTIVLVHFEFKYFLLCIGVKI